MANGKVMDYLSKPESDVLVEHIATRHRKGLYTLCLIYGLPGTGKSSASLRLAQLTSQRIHGENTITEKNIIDSLIELIRFVRSARPGEIAIIEEVSVLFPSRRSMAQDNVSISRVLDTCRKKQVILFANAPILDSIDRHIRCLAHIGIETLKIVKTQGVVVSKPLRLQTNPGSGKTYFHRLNRQGKEVHRIYTRMPEGDIWARYEDKKDKFLNQLYDKLKARAEIKENKELKELGMKSKVVQVRPLTEQELKVYDLVEKQGMIQEAAGRELGVSTPRINQILKNIKKKLQIVKKNKDFNVKNENEGGKNLN